MPETTPELSRIPCPICGAHETRLIEAGRYMWGSPPRRGDLLRCANCETGFCDPQPTETELAALYDEAYFAAEFTSGQQGTYAESEAHYRQLAHEIHATLSQWTTGRLLEVGAAGGACCAAMRDEGWQVEGIELSPEACAWASKTYGLELHTGTLSDAPWEAGSFDAVVMLHVFEHMPDPHAALQRVYNLLKPDGFALIEVPTFVNSPLYRVMRAAGPALRWLGLMSAANAERFRMPQTGPYPPYHIFEYTPDALERLLKRHGMRVVQRRSYAPNPEYNTNPLLKLGFAAAGVLVRAGVEAGNVTVLARKGREGNGG